MQYLKLCLLLLIFGTIGIPMVAQTNTTLTIALPDWWEGQLDEAVLFGEFEANHPGVTVAVNFVSNQHTYFMPPQFNAEEHITKTLDYATQGDVLYTGSSQLTVEGTRTGAYLDLSPLAITDTDLDINDFYPAFWQSFQWEGGIWAIPVGGSLIMNVYDKNAFDSAGLAYPATSWTIYDYANYARSLAKQHENGEISVPGMITYYPQSLYYSLLNRGLYDQTTFPESANFSGDDVIDLLRTWISMNQEDIANPVSQLNYNSDDIPLLVEDTWRVTNRYMPEGKDWQAALLANGRAGLRTEGFAVSGGTDFPELAYELVVYLTKSTDLINFFFVDSPARISMSSMENENNALVFGEKTPELQALLDQAIQNAIPTGEMRYYGYLDYAINIVQNEGKTVEEALSEMEQKIAENLALAEQIGSETNLFVDSASATPALSAGEIQLKFGMNTLVSPVPNRDQWEQVAADFALQDAEVGLIDYNFGFNSVEQVAEENDCFYRQLNDLSSAPLNAILPLDPYLAADPNFNLSDMVNGVLPHVTLNDRVWGLPTNFTPYALWINNQLFNQAGIPIPQGEWSISEFVDALQRLESIADAEPFQPRQSYILMLIAAFGGLPIDPRLDNVAPDVTAPETLNAIRQALDLHKNGLIHYSKLTDFGGGAGGRDELIGMYDGILWSIDYRVQQRTQGITDDMFSVAMFPYGTSVKPITLSVGASYISASTPYADACYRWISYLTNHPELFDGMPARKSNLESTRSQGDDLYQVYSTIATLLEDPNTVILPLFSAGSPTSYIYQYWMFDAFDAYVLEGAILEDELAQAQIFIDAYAGCIAPLEQVDMNTFETDQARQRHYQQYADCAVQIDPNLQTLFPT